MGIRWKEIELVWARFMPEPGYRLDRLVETPEGDQAGLVEECCSGRWLVEVRTRGGGEITFAFDELSEAEALLRQLTDPD